MNHTMQVGDYDVPKWFLVIAALVVLILLAAFLSLVSNLLDLFW